MIKTYKTGGGVLTANSMTVPVSSFTTNINDGVALELDGGRPTISSVTSSSVDGSYSIGETINITVNFSENVSLNTGNLKITLETGDTDNYLEIAAASISSSYNCIRYIYCCFWRRFNRFICKRHRNYWRWFSYRCCR